MLLLAERECKQPESIYDKLDNKKLRFIELDCEIEDQTMGETVKKGNLQLIYSPSGP